MRALGSPLRPRFDTEHSGVLLWQQVVEIGWWIGGARAVAEGVRALVALEDRPHESRIVSGPAGRGDLYRDGAGDYQLRVFGADRRHAGKRPG